jgi:hypothetical protein
VRPLQLVLRILSIAFIAVAALHLTMGMHADLMLGVPISAQMAADPSLDSQNRFYGVSFSLMGIALWIGLQDLRRYEPIIVATLAVLFAAGLARAVAWGLHGAPAPALIGITAADLLLPPVLMVWLRHSLHKMT